MSYKKKLDAWRKNAESVTASYADLQRAHGAARDMLDDIAQHAAVLVSGMEGSAVALGGSSPGDFFSELQTSTGLVRAELLRDVIRTATVYIGYLTERCSAVERAIDGLPTAADYSQAAKETLSLPATTTAGILDSLEPRTVAFFEQIGQLEDAGRAAERRRRLDDLSAPRATDVRRTQEAALEAVGINGSGNTTSSQAVDLYTPSPTRHAGPGRRPL